MGNKNQTTTSNTTSAPDSQAYAAYQSLLQRAQGVANTPYQAYTGELVAPVNQQQTQGITGINSFAQAAQPSVNAGLQSIANAGAPLTAATIQQYMNPYTQHVVDATQAQFNNQNAQQQQQLTGNAIAQGALGGNRTAVAAAELANQQQLAQAPVIAGLYNQGYGQAVNTAQTEQLLGLQAGSLTGNLGIAGQQAGLQGAGAQLGAGTVQQQTQQMLDAAKQAQFQQQQAFPYQQTQWLAGIDTGVGSQMGGTSSGQTTSPGPSTAGQIFGGLTSGVGMLGATGAFGSSGWLASALPMLAMSDRRVKENIKSIGKTHDGQTLYRYNYKGSPQVHIGLIAQEVEKKHPEAVKEIGGIKHVDYKEATDDSIKRAAGGAVGYADGGLAGIPYAGGPIGAGSYIPTNSIVHGPGAPHASAPQPYNPQQPDLNKDMKSIADMANTIRRGNTPGNPLSLAPTNMGVSSPDTFGPVDPGIAGANAATSGIYKRGGVVGYDSGGAPTFDERFNAAFPNSSNNTDGVINPDEPYRMPNPEAVKAWRDSTPMGIGEPDPGQPIMDDQSLPTNDRAVAKSDGVAPSSRMAFTGEGNNTSLPPEITQGYADTGVSGPGTPANAPAPSSGVNFGADSKLWPSLMSAGFGMMASRSPFLGVAIGEGGERGMAQYGAEQQREWEQKQFAQQQALQRERMMMPYQQMTADQKAMMAWHQQEAIRQAMQPVKIGTDALNRDVMAVRDLKSGRYLDPVTMKPIDPAILQRSTLPTASPAQFNVPGEEGPVSGGTPLKPTPVDNGVPTQIKAGDDPSDVIPMEAKPTANDGKNYQVLQMYPELAGKLKAVDEGRLSIPHAVGFKNKDAFMNILTQYDPDFSDILWNARNKQWLDLNTNGNAGKMILATNQLLPHLETASQKAEALDNSNFPGYNKIRNWWSANVYQNPKIKDFETVRTVAATDTAKLLRGTGAMSEGEIREWEHNMLSADSPRSLQQVIHTLASDLIDARIDSIKQSFRINTRQEPPDFVSPKAKAALESIKQRWAKVEGTEAGTNAPGQAGTTAPALTDMDKKALDWANANPNDPRAAAIKKKHGIQ